MSSKAPKLLFFITEDWYFCSHRLPLAIAAKEAGYDVSIVTRITDHKAMITAAGIRVLPTTIKRRSLSPLRELMALIQIIKIYRSEQPDIIHQVALKPVLYGTLAAHFTKHAHVINALAGLGFVFTSSSLKSRGLRPFVSIAFRLLLNRKHNRVILQNPDDRELLINKHILHQKQARLIRGSGVNLTHFRERPEPEGTITIVLAARMLWDKGIGEFAAAAQIIHKKGITARFLLVGKCDHHNPAAIPQSQLTAWEKEGILKWLGHQENMVEVLTKSHIVCLPSYREGLPKVLIEAAACGRPIITTDAPGCREVVTPSVNGLLVPLKDAEALASAIQQLIEDSTLRKQMGAQSRKIAEEHFSEEQVIKETLALYKEVLT